jgi:signal transduction histidine kinase
MSDGVQPGGRNPIGSRVVLILGFGGLLTLMALAGIDALQALHQIQASNDAIREDFLARNRVLEQIRSDLYLSGTYLRDYLLEPEAGNAEVHRNSLIRVRNEMDRAVSRYRAILSPEEKLPFNVLTRELSGYWELLEPAVHWNPEQRRDRGWAFLQHEVFPRRIAMLRLADQIALVNESQLDSGKQQVARTFAEFRRRLAGTAALTVGLGLLLALFSVRKILELEREAAVRFREIANARTELKQLSARLVDIQENERRTISRELHDEVGQALSAALVEMGNLSAAIRAGDEASLPGHVEAVKKLVENCVAVVRNMALLLRPSMLDDLGLVPALQWQAREVSKRTGMRVRVAAEHVSDDLSEEHKTCIYRVVQEALHNCARHASAQMVRVNVRQEPGRILLSVYDDGKGFEPQARGMGLLGIEERVTNLGGRFEIHAAPGQGTSLQIVLPLAGAAVAAAQQVTS